MLSLDVKSLPTGVSVKDALPFTEIKNVSFDILIYSYIEVKVFSNLTESVKLVKLVSSPIMDFTKYLMT